MGFIRVGTVSMENVSKYFNEDNELNFECFTLTHEEEMFLLDALKTSLVEIGKENIFEFVSYIFRELLNNAKKANTKRIYFEDIKLNIDNKLDYEKGMKGFKTIPSEKIDYYLQLQEERGYYIRSTFKIVDDDFIIAVIDDVIMKQEELEIVKDRKKRAEAFKSIDEALEIVLNNAEGAGLGIIISILMLKKLGLSGENLDIESFGKETISKIVIPLSLITEEQKVSINEILVKEINDLPQFPEHILILQKRLVEPKIDLKEVSKLVSHDPGLTGEVIRFANSAMFSTPQKISSLFEAIKIIGLRGLKNIIFTYGTKNILNKRFKIKKMQEIWEHSYKVGYFAFNFAKKYVTKEELEEIYIGGILHDLGKILTFAINPVLVEKINHLCIEKGIPIRIIEDITSGYDHSIIGGLIARKWNFPEQLISSIEFHHNPLDCDEKYKNFIYCIYIANSMVSNFYSNGNFYDNIDRIVLNWFKIYSLSQFELIRSNLEEGYQNQKRKDEN